MDSIYKSGFTYQAEAAGLLCSSNSVILGKIWPFRLVPSFSRFSYLKFLFMIVHSFIYAKYHVDQHTEPAGQLVNSQNSNVVHLHSEQSTACSPRHLSNATEGDPARHSLLYAGNFNPTITDLQYYISSRCTT